MKTTWIIIVILAAALVAVFIYFKNKMDNTPSNAQIQANLQNLGDWAASTGNSSSSNPFAASSANSSPSPYF